MYKRQEFILPCTSKNPKESTCPGDPNGASSFPWPPQPGPCESSPKSPFPPMRAALPLSWPLGPSLWTNPPPPSLEKLLSLKNGNGLGDHPLIFTKSWKT